MASVRRSALASAPGAHQHWRVRSCVSRGLRAAAYSSVGPDIAFMHSSDRGRFFARARCVRRSHLFAWLVEWPRVSFSLLCAQVLIHPWGGTLAKQSGSVTSQPGLLRARWGSAFVSVACPPELLAEPGRARSRRTPRGTFDRNPTHLRGTFRNTLYPKRAPLSDTTNTLHQQPET